MLVAEDEPLLADTVAEGLRRLAMAVDVCYDGAAAIELAMVHRYDVAVLDRDMPGATGDQVCKWIIGAGAGTRVLMLTAAAGIRDRVDGLTLGADDYLTKPFSIRELAARVHVLLRRVERAGARSALVLGDLEIDEAEHRVRRSGAEAHLTRTEFELLLHLAKRPRTVLGRDRLLAEVWGWPDGASTRTVDSHVKALRRKLGADLIRTVHGVGYALEVPR